MSAPPIPGLVSGRRGGRMPDAWNAMWDVLDDGQWHCGQDLRVAAARDAGLDPRVLGNLLCAAVRHGLLECEKRSTGDQCRRVGRSQPLVIARPRAWYRRLAGAA